MVNPIQAADERARALDADQASRDAFKAWQAEKDPSERERLRFEYKSAEAEAKRLWDIVGPDPFATQLKKVMSGEQEEDEA